MRKHNFPIAHALLDAFAELDNDTLDARICAAWNVITRVNDIAVDLSYACTATALFAARRLPSLVAVLGSTREAA